MSRRIVGPALAFALVAIGACDTGGNANGGAGRDALGGPDGGVDGAACVSTSCDAAADCETCPPPNGKCPEGSAPEVCDPAVAAGSPLVFAGPFASWIDVKHDFGAKGDGVTDDSAALQKALSSAATSGKPYAVYFPAGTYKITKTLTLKYQHIVLYGEDPTKTIITWAGSSGADMVLANGVSWSIWGRLTFDGGGTAGGGLHFSWDAQGPGEYSTQGASIIDAVFRKVGKGIIAGSTPPGQMDSDVGIVRTRFESCSVAGLSTESWNALDYWIFDSTFVDNARGLTNRYGSGNFNVRNSYFSGSTIADVDIGKNAIFLGLRGNTSIGSKKFLLVDSPYDAFSATLQKNRIVDSVDSVAVEANYLGDLILLDNQIRSRAGASGPAVVLNAQHTTGDFLSIGNRYTVASAESVKGPTVRAWQLDNQVLAAAQIPASPPVLPATPERVTENVIDVPAGASTATIQAAIDQSATLAGKHPVIHLSAGEYQVTQSLVVPPNVDVTITGDGWGTIVWGKGLKAPVFRLQGPSHAVIQDMKINASMSSDANVVTSAEGILVENADQPGARVYGEVDTFLHNRGTDVLSDKLANGNVDLHGVFLARGGDLAVHAIGVGTGTKGRVGVFGGTSIAWRNPSGSMYKVSAGGQMVVEDMWYEANEGPTVVRLGAGDSGTFTFNGAQLSQYSGTGQSSSEPIIDINGFAGRVTILGALFAFPDSNSGRFPTVRNESSSTRVLGSGLNALEGGGKVPYMLRSGSGGTVSFFSNKLDTQSGTGNIAIADSGDPVAAAFIVDMLSSLRTVLPRPFVKAPSGVTNVGLQRLTIQYATNAIHVVPTANP